MITWLSGRIQVKLKNQAWILKGRFFFLLHKQHWFIGDMRKKQVGGWMKDNFTV